MSKPRVGDHADLSYAYGNSPAGRHVEVLSEPDADGMVRVQFVKDFWVSRDDLELWADQREVQP